MLTLCPKNPLIIGFTVIVERRFPHFVLSDIVTCKLSSSLLLINGISPNMCSVCVDFYANVPQTTRSLFWCPKNNGFIFWARIHESITGQNQVNKPNLMFCVSINDVCTYILGYWIVNQANLRWFSWLAPHGSQL